MKSSSKRVVRFLAIAAVAFALPYTAGATVRKEGNWPDDEKKVSFEFEGKPKDGLKKLADEAGWSLVMSSEVARGSHDVHVAVEDQPADAVLEALFIDGDVVARRSGTLVTVIPAGTETANVTAPVPPVPGANANDSAPGAAPPIPPIPPIPPPPPIPSERGEDRNVMGGSLVVRKGEIVHTVTVTGGSVVVEGTVTGDLVVAGGSAKIEPGARVIGNATVFGGSIKVEGGARIDGDVGVVGGALKREEGAIIGGQIVDKSQGKHGRVNVTLNDGNVSSQVEAERPTVRAKVLDRVHQFGASLTKMALLFVLGCVFLALATGRMERLRVEVAARPMRSFAMGIAYSLLAAFTLIVLCITIVGIPFAVLGGLLATFAVFVSLAAVLTTFGAAVIGHRTTNPYAHLLFGCAAFLLASSIPYIGGIVAFVTVLVAIGALVSTRLGGLADPRRRAPELV